MATLYPFIEQVRDESPMNLSFSMETGQATGLYQLDGVTSANDLYGAFYDLIGSTVVPVNTVTGQLSRGLPACHAYMPWYVTGVSGLHGIGGNFTTITNIVGPYSTVISQYPLYSSYRIPVTFGPRPYPLYPDELVATQITKDWYNEAGTLHTYTYYPEYERFVQQTITPSDDYVSIQLGQMAFNSTSLPADAKPFTSTPKKFLGNQTFVWRWWYVPFRYWTSPNSYLKRFRGYVNQNEFTSASLGNFAPGTLAFLGAKVQNFTPPFQTTINFGGGLSNYEQLCNIDLVFSYADRTAVEAPFYIPANSNVVYESGHNLNWYFGSANEALAGNWVFTATVPTGDHWSTGMYPSCPLEILWADPDSTVVGIT